MSSLQILSRWNRRSTLGNGVYSRLGVSPPSLRQAPEGIWRRLLFWLLTPLPGEAGPPLNRVPGVRVEFMRAAADVDGDDAETLRNRIALSRSLRELWHLRADLFRVVALAHNQGEAESRLRELNRHFPTRAPQSQFGGF